MGKYFIPRLSLAYALGLMLTACASGVSGEQVMPEPSSPGSVSRSGPNDADDSETSPSRADEDGSGPSGNAPSGADDTDEPDETTADNDPATCLNGTWLADNDYFLASIRQFGDQIKKVSGRVELRFANDGTTTTEYQDWRITGASEGIAVTIHRAGRDTGEFTVADGVISLEETRVDSTLVVSAAGTEMKVDPDPVKYADAPYTCDQSAAEITTPDGTLRLTRTG